MQHLAVVMDGNRRWAQKQGLKPWFGHKKGVETAEMVINYCLENKIPYLSLYTFSLENFKRPEEERNFIFGPLSDEIIRAVPGYVKNGVKVKFVGNQSYFPEHLVEKIKKVEHETKNCSNMTLQILFCYGGRQELVAAVKQIADAVNSRILNADDISEKTLERYLWTQDVPDPDLVIRTGGMQRLSNFLLYQIAYSEIRFLKCLWPDFTRVDLENTIEEVIKTKRTFGA